MKRLILLVLVAIGVFAQTAPLPPLPGNSSTQQLQSSIVALQMYNNTLAATLKQIQLYVSSCSVIPVALLQQVSDILAVAKTNSDTATQVVAIVTGPVATGNK